MTVYLRGRLHGVHTMLGPVAQFYTGLPSLFYDVELFSFVGDHDLK
jgi:hypothetical protein